VLANETAGFVTARWKGAGRERKEGKGEGVERKWESQ